MKSCWKIKKYPLSLQRNSLLTKIKEFKKDAVNKLTTTASSGKKKVSVNLNFKFKSFTLFALLNGVLMHVYNGVKYLPIMVNDIMISKPMGSFVLTKRITRDIHIKQAKNKGGKKPFSKKKS